MFWKVFPEYLLYGMTEEQFWHGDPRLCKAYRQAHKLRIEQRNQELWLQGLYNYDAVAVALGNALSKHKQKYIKEPVKLFKPTEEEQKLQAEQTRKKMVERLNSWKAAFEKQQANKPVQTE